MIEALFFDGPWHGRQVALPDMTFDVNVAKEPTPAERLADYGQEWTIPTLVTGRYYAYTTPLSESPRVLFKWAGWSE